MILKGQIPNIVLLLESSSLSSLAQHTVTSHVKEKHEHEVLSGTPELKKVCSLETFLKK